MAIVLTTWSSWSTTNLAVGVVVGPGDGPVTVGMVSDRRPGLGVARPGAAEVALQSGICEAASTMYWMAPTGAPVLCAGGPVRPRPDSSPPVCSPTPTGPPRRSSSHPRPPLPGLGTSLLNAPCQRHGVGLRVLSGALSGIVDLAATDATTTMLVNVLVSVGQFQ